MFTKQFPHELVTYGGNGQVFSNWAQVSLCNSARGLISHVLKLIGTSSCQSFIFVVYFMHETGSLICFQFLLVMHYLSIMTDEQTLVMYSGHPLGLFPSSPSSPRAVITNGMVGIM